MNFDLNKLQPDLPSFSWAGKEYTADPSIFYPKARIIYTKLVAEGSKYGEALIQNRLKLIKLTKAKKTEKAKKEVVELQKKIDNQGKNIKVNDEEIIDFLETIFPGTKAAKLFTDDSELPDYAKAGLWTFVACKIMGTPFVPPGCQFGHDEAEAMLAIVVKEKAAREMAKPDDVYKELQRQIEKK